MEPVTTLPEFDNAEIFSIARGYAVLPKRIIFASDHPITLVATQPKGMTACTSLTILARTQLDVSDDLLATAQRAVNEHLTSETLIDEETELIALTDIPISILEPVSVKGKIIVPEILSDSAEWTFDVSPMGVWPGRVHLEVNPSAIPDVIDWWENGASEFGLHYDYDLGEDEHASFSAESGLHSQTESQTGTSTLSMWEALKARVKTRDEDPPDNHIQTTIKMSEEDRRNAMSVITI